jgi:glycosyltransferase involved in cell wall biosynthesis
MGHGILTQSFINENRLKVFSNDKKIITSIGRITPIKDLATLIKAAKILVDKKYQIGVHMIGPEVNEADKKYRQELDRLVKESNLENVVLFVGGKKPQETKQELWSSDMHVNLCPTGGLDKAVIESACSGVHSFVANLAYKKYYGELADDYLFEHGSAEMLADKIENMLNLPKEVSASKRQALQTKMVENFDVKSLIEKVLNILKSC